ncbi:MAG: AIR carboxylase family protein [Candidatus Omnitrophica bacterium]|nr:AIR carboxylase family protein [Candidatus Omnitrophota bacterium]
MAKIGIIVDNEEDLKYVEEIKKILDELGILYEVNILSGMDSLNPIDEYIENVERNGIDIIIVCASIPTYLPGIIASRTIIPVIGVPLPTKEMVTTDIVFSIVQMPEGVPVACMSFGKAGIKNSAILAGEILSIKDKNLKEKIKELKSRFK